VLPRRLVKRAMHGTRMLSWQEIRQFYGREVVNLRHEGRWVFLNTLFSVSEAVMYMQARPVGCGAGCCSWRRCVLSDCPAALHATLTLPPPNTSCPRTQRPAPAPQLVDRLDYGAFTSSSAGAMSYTGLYRLVSKALYRTHVEGKLKREIMQVRWGCRRVEKHGCEACGCGGAGGVVVRLHARAARAPRANTRAAVCCDARQAPEKFVQPDPEMAATLLDQKEAGKMLLLITNRCACVCLRRRWWAARLVCAVV
jgi:hypothetical protein